MVKYDAAKKTFVGESDSDWLALANMKHLGSRMMKGDPIPKISEDTKLGPGWLKSLRIALIRVRHVNGKSLEDLMLEFRTTKNVVAKACRTPRDFMGLGYSPQQRFITIANQISLEIEREWGPHHRLSVKLKACPKQEEEKVTPVPQQQEIPLEGGDSCLDCVYLRVPDPGEHYECRASGPHMVNSMAVWPILNVDNLSGCGAIKKR